jgi:hypothetical protein
MTTLAPWALENSEWHRRNCILARPLHSPALAYDSALEETPMSYLRNARDQLFERHNGNRNNPRY